MKSKLLSVLLATMMLLTMLPLSMVGVSAATSGTTGNCTWVLIDTVLTISGNGAMADYSNLGDQPWGNKITTATIEDGVTSVGEFAFFGCESLTSVTIGNSVTSIGGWAFYYCSKLKTVNFGNSITNIGTSAFFECHSLSSVKLPNSLTTIDSGAFGRSALRSIIIPNGVTTIGESAFWQCGNLASVDIPDSVTTIEHNAFSECYNLTSISIPNSVTNIGVGIVRLCENLTAINVAQDNPNYCSDDGVLFNKDKTTLIEFPGGKTSMTAIPSTVTCIGVSAFSYCYELISIAIPNSVTTISRSAFLCCAKLNSVIIPNSVISIGSSAFDQCYSLTNVYYDGNDVNKANISIGNYNSAFLNATWHYAADPISKAVTHSATDTENGNGLAFRFGLATDDMGVTNKTQADLTNATVNYLGKECKLVGMGAVLTNSDAAAENLTLNAVNNTNVLNIPTVYLCDLESDSCAFATRIINIPDSALERTVYARPYFVVEVDGEQITIYGDVNAATCAEYL